MYSSHDNITTKGSYIVYISAVSDENIIGISTWRAFRNSARFLILSG
jgi:hypothetical protein